VSTSSAGWNGLVLDYLDADTLCWYLLQQGLFVADACYCYGDHVPDFAQLKKSDPARILPGYDYDAVTEEVVLSRMAVEEGRIVLPDGMSYRLLVLQDRSHISLPVLRKIKQLVEAGATVLGPRPQTATGLQDYPRCDEEVRAIAAELWGPPDPETTRPARRSVAEFVRIRAVASPDHGSLPTSITDPAPPPPALAVRRVGQGRVISGATAREVLEADGVAPDAEFFVAVDGQLPPASAIDYLHRRTEQADIYFVSNQGATPADIRAVFRVVARQPELWDPVSGTMRDAAVNTAAGGRTAIPLELPPYGSVFVVFRAPLPAARRATDATRPLAFSPVAELAGPWQVSFDPRWGGPANVTFEKLEDWTQRSDDGIRYYSGTAVYRNAFDLPPPAQAVVAGGKKLFLDLGRVKELAEVRLNGQSLGVVWCPPWHVDVTGAVREKGNRLEIDVVNFWPNRLIGDAALPPERRLTTTNVTTYKKDSPLLPSGLLGPVRLMAED
jgi:hypothetical protein